MSLTVVAAGCSTNSAPHVRSEDTGPAANTSSLTSEVPGWTSVCVQPDGRPAPQFVGLTVAQAKQLAERGHLTLVVYGAGGKCLIQAAMGYAHPVEVNVDRLGPAEGIPQNAHVLTAQYGPA